MKAEDVDSALVRAGASLRASLEQQVDVDAALDRLRDSIRARTAAAAVSEMGRSHGRIGDDSMRRPDSTATARPGRAVSTGADGTEGGDAAIRLLYDQHAGPLLRYAVRLTGGDRQRAEDVVRETLGRAWHSPHRLDAPGRSLRPWLMTVARRIATGDPAPESFPGPSDGAEGVDALRELSRSDREILIETYFRGRTVAEAAERLNLPLGTVKSRTYLALRALRAALEQRHP